MIRKYCTDISCRWVPIVRVSSWVCRLAGCSAGVRSLRPSLSQSDCAFEHMYGVSLLPWPECCCSEIRISCCRPNAPTSFSSASDAPFLLSILFCCLYHRAKTLVPPRLSPSSFRHIRAAAATACCLDLLQKSARNLVLLSYSFRGWEILGCQRCCCLPIAPHLTRLAVRRTNQRVL